MANLGIDPISLEILWTRLVGVVDEAAATYVRTSFSTLVRESNDYAVVLTDHEGHSLAQSTLSVPSFIGTLPATVKHFLAAHPVETLSPGDVLITNDPWMGTGQIHDITLAMPIFWKDAVVGFATITSHMPDIGGRIRGSASREIFEEGLQIPILKLIRAGTPDPTIIAFIERNVRVPDLTMGDVWGEVAACRMLEERIVALLDETGIDLASVGRELRRRSEKAMREAIAAIPDGTYRYHIQHDGFEEPIDIHCRIDVTGDTIAIDYANTSCQLPRAVNVVPIYAFAYSAFALKTLLCPDVPNNEGSFEPITTSAPLGSILNPTYPAASGARGMVGHMLVPAIMGALAEVLPDRVMAEGSGNSVLTLNGQHAGRRYATIHFFTAGQGATADGDGLSCICFPSNVSNTPIEIMESESPILVRRREIRRGTGGAGQHRGGDGLAFEFEFVGDEPGTCAFIVTRMRVPPRGFLGGGDGVKGQLLLNGKPISHDENWTLTAGDRVVIETASGGGFRPVGA
jgi:N-methylhydantoinase B